MSPLDLLALRFLLASCGCLAAGLGVWALTALCRRFAGFAAQRSLWLLGQATVLAAFLVVLLPHSERLRMVPPIELAETSQARPAVPSATGPLAAAAAPANVPNVEQSQRSWLAYGAQAWLLMYLLGLAYSITKLWHARRILHGLSAAGCRLHALDQHDGFAGAPTRTPAPAVVEVDAPISPMLFGLFRPRLLLPLHLRSFAAAQQQMIVEHELTHLRRGDLYWMGAGILLQTLLWFNPFMRLLRENLSWAQELGCDRDVLRGRPQAQRKAYAAALVAQLTLQHRTVKTALAFGGVSASTLAARIALIRRPAAAPRGPWARCASLAGLLGIFAASLALQPALAWRIDASAAAAQPTTEASAWPLGDAASPTALSCTALADAASGQRLVLEGQCDERVTPASTFNIAVSLMGYDSGILSDQHAPSLPFKKGYADWNPSWRATTDPSSWLKNSVVWYAQQVTSRLGAARFQRYVADFNYGNHDVSGDAGKDNGLTLSWVSSSLKISPLEQLAFLRSVVKRDLPLTAKAYDMTVSIMPSQTLANGWEVHGKTGTAAVVLADGRDDQKHQYGWYVGWATKGQRSIVFARLLLDRRQASGAAGTRVKAAFLRDLPARLDAL
ncbi:class D beta-lactamase [Rugamonas rubra]|uniref:Beta-lactamase class D n=1 Tax=Rugamonas rubra TaxID=758825 RepID=A0A1I4PPR4_9BURK|nr:class D beta-lactamase [Rugamonas rubra]SFM29767.1 Beta-lactamase class D [Rugamonas rubra]